MSTKEGKNIKFTLKNIIILISLNIALIYVFIFSKMYFPFNIKESKETVTKIENKVAFKISEAEEISVENLIEDNLINEQTEEITKKEEILEYLTLYKTNKEIPKGVSYVVQEGRLGIQEITIKTIYDKDKNIISEEQLETKIKKASANKIVEIGGGTYTSNYNVKVKDTVYVTSDVLGFWSEPNEESRKITTLTKDNSLKVLEIKDGWYRVSFKNMTGWIKSECTTYINLNADNIQEYGVNAKTKQQLLSKVSFNMKLDEPSGLTLEQFKKVLKDDKDVNNVFINNAEYFYYIEKQYNINGVFVAAVGIHESAWGTSKIAIQKNNLFGYGAYDSNPYNSAYTFSNYSESIDLLGRVLVKYYLNPSGTKIYGGEVAAGTYYNGKTLSAVNVKYATDKNWANAVYNHMKYLYNKL